MKKYLSEFAWFRANTLSTAFVIDSGDMTNDPVYAASPGNLAQYDDYLGYIAPLTMPIYQAPGNHDIGYFDYVGSTYEEDHEALLAAFENKIGPVNQSFTHQGFRFILINNNPALSGQPGYISPATLNWVESELQQGEKAFLFCHIPILENGTGSPWGAAAQSLVDLCEQYDVVAVGYGHRHETHEKTLNNTQYIMCPDLKDVGHQSVLQYQVYEDHYQLRQYDVVSQESILLGSYAFEAEPAEPLVPLVPSAPDYAWAFDDGPAATTAIAKYGPVDGQIVGASDSSNAHFSYTGNRALEFDGSNDRVDLNGVNLTAGGNSAVTVSAWVYSHDTSETKKAQIFGNWFQGGDKQTVSFLDYTGGGRMIAETTTGPSGTDTGGGDYPRNEWVHLVGILDGAETGDGLVAIYVNGVLSDDNYTAALLRDIVNEGTYGIGGDVGTTDALRYFDGLIDELAVWRSVLTEENILWLYENSIMDIAYHNNPLPGDANYDGEVNDADALILATNWLNNGASWAQGDFSGDGKVDDVDATILASNYSPGGTSTSVPEPTLIVTLLPVLIAFLFLGQRYR